MEILAPAGNKQNLIQAVSSGANAVYLGLKNFSARSSAENFDFNDLKYAVAYAKTFNVKVYVTVNTLIKQNELSDFLNSVKQAYSFGVDAFILQDIFLGKLLKSYIPDICLHLSTQAGVCNEYGAIMAKEYGFSRVILARETKLNDIKKIADIIETEVFVQGALCTSFSGHCYFSSFIGGNSGNRGACKQPCRKLYTYQLDNGEVLNKGFTLSLADLCLSNKLSVLKDIGVKSIKIEGRMRSEEYVAASVQYYKSVLDGKPRIDLFKALKTIYNRGDYTEGLAFNQQADFISDKIQNNKGLKVGEVGKIYGDKFLFKNFYNYEVGDCFKILRNGREVGNAICVNEGNKPVLKFKGKVYVGDDVNITKDVSLLSKILLPPKRKELLVSVNAKVGEYLTLSCNGITVKSNNILETAKSAPATVESINANLQKVDTYPFIIKSNINIEGNPFIVNSVLNNLRSALYSKLFYEKYCKNTDNIVNYDSFSILNTSNNFNKIAIITNKEVNLPNCVTDVIIAPLNYTNTNYLSFYKNINAKRWLYIPPFLSSNDINIILNVIDNFYGIYGDSYWCLQFAKTNNLKLFAGCGFNVFNSIDYNELINNNVTNLVASKELTELEMVNSLGKNTFILTRGSLEIMDLVYCPLSKNCKNCKINDTFVLQDTEKRNFSVLRYKTDECRFKVFNNAKIAFDTKNFSNKIYDLRCLSNTEIEVVLNSEDIKIYKENIKNYTVGNYVRGVE